ncbi:hypothetical protein AcV5_009750 [Taiwanofungus camphoratus]|nr:hypothetical protein AcV5_009750 [Antrodia cinnamomea]
MRTGACMGDRRAWCPSSERAFAADRGVIVRLRLTPTVNDPAESSPESASASVSESESESGSDDVECVDAAAQRCRVLRPAGDVRPSADGGRPKGDAPSRPRSPDDGDGEFPALRRAAISRNAATEIRCGESAVGDGDADADAKLPARGWAPPTARLLAEIPDSAEGGRSSGSSGGPEPSVRGGLKNSI